MNNLAEILSSDLKQFINFQINYSFSCCDKYCQDICRCAEIIDIEIQNLNLPMISRKIYKDLYSLNEKSYERRNKLTKLLEGYDNKFQIYCLERILNCNKLYDICNWKYEVVLGYYGQELDKVYLQEEVVEAVEKQINQFLSLTKLKEKVQFLLNLEYGFVLPSLVDCEYRIKQIPKEKIYFGQQSRYNKTKGDSIYIDREKNQIMGICLKEGDIYRVVDGYNRLSQNKHKKIFIIEAYHE